MSTTTARPRTRLAVLLAAAALAVTACGGSKAKTATRPATQAPSTSAPTSTVAPTSSSSTNTAASSTTVAAPTTTAPSVPACATDGLRVSSGGPTDPGAGSVTYPLTFTNTATAPCTLSGFPGVSAVSGAGQQIGQPAARTSRAPSVVVVQPGQSATALVRVAQAQNYDPGTCGTPTPAAGFRVYPPGQTAGVVTPASLTVCSGAAVQMQINPITG